MQRVLRAWAKLSRMCNYFEICSQTNRLVAVLVVVVVVVVAVAVCRSPFAISWPLPSRLDCIVVVLFCGMWILTCPFKYRTATTASECCICVSASNKSHILLLLPATAAVQQQKRGEFTSHTQVSVCPCV